MTKDETGPRQALVTGGSRGIGAAIVRALAGAGHRVIFTYRGQEAAAEALAEEVGGDCHRLDLADGEATLELARRLEEEAGSVDVLVHNAGMTRDALLPFLTPELWDEVLEVNLRGPYLLTRALVRGMMMKRWGRVIAVASASGVTGNAGQAHYGAAKGGLVAFTKSLALEGARFGITANAVMPGLIDTDMLAQLPEKKLAEMKQAVPLGRLGRPEEVARLVTFLVSDDAGYITGQTVRIDGGMITS